MPIVSVSRWRIPSEDAARILRDAAPLLKNHGATSVQLGRIHSGEHTGATTIVITYQTWEAYGNAMQKQHQDQQYHTHLKDAQRLGKLESQHLIVTDEISLG